LQRVVDRWSSLHQHTRHAILDLVNNTSGDAYGWRQRVPEGHDAPKLAESSEESATTPPGGPGDHGQA